MKIFYAQVVHVSRGGLDKVFVSHFLQDVQEVFYTAQQGGSEECELDILVSREGGIRVISGSDWALEMLRQHHGAETAYRVTRHSGHVRLEARSAEQSCELRSMPPARRIASAIPEFAQYLMIQ
ncbi:MAG TPA: hypothetical protein VG675_04325 [Bryobacteraceae bacterium]|nr:hypothetical protein [Bryobacteraceae bacterium]